VDVATGETYVMTMPDCRACGTACRPRAGVGEIAPRTASRPARGGHLLQLSAGRESIGASYLNVLPESLLQILKPTSRRRFCGKWRADERDELFTAIRTFGNNPAPGTNVAVELDKLARSGRVQLLPISEYRVWFDQLPASLRAQIVAKWGEPEQSKTMVWRDDTGKPFFVFPAQRWGNLLFAPQPTRGWDQDIEAAYHDVTLPPHHQYLAFYLGCKRAFRLTRWPMSARTQRTNGCRAKKSVTPPPTQAKSLSAQCHSFIPISWTTS